MHSSALNRIAKTHSIDLHNVLARSESVASIRHNAAKRGRAHSDEIQWQCSCHERNQRISLQIWARAFKPKAEMFQGAPDRRRKLTTWRICRISMAEHKST